MLKKSIITIFQYKRVILPHFFIRHIYPKMKSSFPGEMELHLIQHTPTGGVNFTKSKHLPEDRLRMVSEWTEKGMFDGANIIQHSDFCSRDAVMPTYKRGIKLALDREADFHLWLEDDALVFDKGCKNWEVDLKDKDVGVYRNYNMINCAFFVGTPEFEKRIYSIMEDENNWDMRHPFFLPGTRIMDINAPKIEAILTRNCNSRVTFDESYAGRTHTNHTESYAHLIKIMCDANPEQANMFMRGIEEQWKSEHLK